MDNKYLGQQTFEDLIARLGFGSDNSSQPEAPATAESVPASVEGAPIPSALPSPDTAPEVSFPPSDIPAMDQYQFAQSLGMNLPPPPAPYTPMENPFSAPPENMSVGTATPPSMLPEVPVAPPSNDALKLAVAKLKGGGSPDTSLEMMDMENKELSNAQKTRNDLQLMASMGKAGARIGAALATAGASTSDKMLPDYMSDVEKLADQGVSDVTLRRKMFDDLIKRQSAMEALTTARAKSDPGSDVSKLYRSLAQQYTPNVPEDMSASQIEKILPVIGEMYKAKISAEDKKKTDAEREDFRKASSSLKLHERVAQNANPAAPRGGMKQISDAKNRILAMKAFAAGKDPSALTPQQVDELAVALNRIVTGGGGSTKTFEHLRANTAHGTLAAVKQWLTSKPQGSQQQEFVKLMLGSADNEEKVIDRRTKDYQFKQLYTFEPDFIKTLGPEEGKKNFYDAVETWTGMPREAVMKMEQDPHFKKQYMPEYDPNDRPINLNYSPVTDVGMSKDIESPNDLVKIVLPNGTPKLIPRSNLQKALDLGAKKVN